MTRINDPHPGALQLLKHRLRERLSTLTRRLDSLGEDADPTTRNQLKTEINIANRRLRLLDDKVRKGGGSE